MIGQLREALAQQAAWRFLMKLTESDMSVTEKYDFHIKSLRIEGVMKISSSVLVSWVSLRLNKLPK